MQPKKTNGRTQEELDRMCRGKHRWSDELAARAGAMQSLERRPEEVTRLYTYRFPVCSGFHLTRVKQRGQKPVRLESTSQSCIQQEMKMPALNDPGRSAGCCESEAIVA